MPVAPETAPAAPPGPAPSLPSETYLPQLDGLRAAAVLLVFLAHFVPSETLDRATEWGRLGMVLFFLLSGYLITGILLKCRDHAASPWGGLKAFYIRRTLRIFPLYYAVLAYFMIRGYKPVKQDIWWFVTYLSNISAAFLRPPGGYSEAFPLWSLSVEEQYYLIWGLVVVFAPRKSLPAICVGMILTSVAYKFAGAIHGWSLWTLWVSTPGDLDSLAFGSLLAILLYEDQENFRLRRALLTIGPWIGLPSLLLLSAVKCVLGYEKVRTMVAYIAFFDLAAGLTLLALLAAAAQKKVYRLGALLSRAPLRLMGKVSYGMYLFHLPVHRQVTNILTKHFHKPGTTGPLVFLLSTMATFGLALLSWRFFEGPINRLRDRFSYYRPAPAPGGQAGTP